MNTEEYVAAAAVIAAAAAAWSSKFTAMFAVPALSMVEWLKLLELMFPQVQKFHDESATLARTFYDSERLAAHPTLPRNEVLRPSYDFKTFVQAMEPLRKEIMLPDTPRPTEAKVALHVAREVENAGRQQIIRAVQQDEAVKEVVAEFQKAADVANDIEALARQQAADRLAAAQELLQRIEQRKKVQVPKPEPVPTRPNLTVIQTELRPVQGWARVATGRETCAWCLMLVSRGPVYYSAKTAGLQLDDESAASAFKSGADVQEFMNDWHVGCDCKVVPVFDLARWPGMEAQKRADDLWIEAGHRATAELEANPDKQYYSFTHGRWMPTTDNRETINQLRKMIDAGEVSSQDWAVLQQAA